MAIIVQPWMNTITNVFRLQATPAISEAVFSISSKNMKPMHWRMIELVSPVPTHFQITV